MKLSDRQMGGKWKMRERQQKKVDENVLIRYHCVRPKHGTHRAAMSFFFPPTRLFKFFSALFLSSFWCSNSGKRVLNAMHPYIDEVSLYLFFKSLIPP